DAETRRQHLPGRTAQGTVVQVEARPADAGRGSPLRPARPRPPLFLLFRFYVRRLAADGDGGRRGARSRRQGLFRLHRRRAAATGPLGPKQDRQALRPRSRSQARVGARGRLRQRSPVQPTQVRGGDAVSPGSPDPVGQAGFRGGSARDAGSAHRGIGRGHPAHSARQFRRSSARVMPSAARPYRAREPNTSNKDGNVTVLVTGAAGFIGMHVSAALLSSGRDVLGVDNLNSYYDPALKRARLAELSRYRSFAFAQADIALEGAIGAAASGRRITAIVHLAAQPGVRYLIEYRK